MEEKKFRNKVGWFQFLCCAMVIWSHAGNAELFLGKAGKNHWLSRLEYVHFPAVMGVSIPCFFMISGYLFFRFFTFDQLKEKWKRAGADTSDPISVLEPALLCGISCWKPDSGSSGYR